MCQILKGFFFHYYQINGSGLLCWRNLESHGLFVEPELTPSNTAPPNNMTCMSTHCNCAFCPSWLVKFRQSSLCLSLALEYAEGSNINTGLWNEHQFLITNLFCSVLYPHNLDKTNFQKFEISTKIIVYSYRKAQRRASCSAGILCRGCGAVISNTQSSIYQKNVLGNHEYLEFYTVVSS